MTHGRLLGSVAAVAALTLAPAGLAHAYEGDDEFVTATDTRTEPGDPVEIIVEAGEDSSEATLTVTSQNRNVSDDSIEIAGTQSLTKDTVAGAAEFAVTMHVPGRYTMVGLDENGAEVGRTMVVVVGDGAGNGNGGESDDAAGAGLAGSGGGTSGSLLPSVGADATTTILAGGGLLLVLGGAGVLALSRRRKTQLS